MIDNLKDAITHARKVAENVRYNAYTFTEQDLLDENCRQAKAECLECASEHEQLAAWLTELQERREADKWISVKDKLPEKDGVYLVAIQYVAKYEEGSPIHTIELLASYDTKYGQWSSPDNVIAWRNLPKPYESEAENETDN